MSIGRFTPFWLEGGDHRLYAALHRDVARTPGAPVANPDAPAVLLLPPLLHEYQRSLRFLAEMASSLADAGMPCLRFCHYGTGDSDGEGDQTDMERMASDITRAADLLVRESDGRPLAVLAFRSAALSLQAWLARGGRPDTVVLWDPVLDGAEWLRLRRAEDAQKRATIRAEPGTEQVDAELMGCVVGAQLLRELQDSRWQRDAPSAARRFWLVAHAQQPGWPQLDRRFVLPAAVPTFGEGVLMDASLVFSLPMQSAARELATALETTA